LYTRPITVDDMRGLLKGKSLTNLLGLIGTVLITSHLLHGQSLYPVRGGTGFEPDSRDSKYEVLVAETAELKLTFRHSEKFKPKKGDIWVVWMKVENRSDKPITVDPTKFTAVDDEGRALAGLDAGTAIKRFSDAVAGMMNIVGNVVAGPLAGPSMVAASERGSVQKLNQQSLQIGEVPPRSFKDGLVFFEKSNTKTKEVRANFVGLWTDPIVFSTDDNLRPRATK
jgi:hypothetical protein